MHVFGGAGAGKSLLVDCLLGWEIDTSVRAHTKIVHPDNGNTSEPPPESFAEIGDHPFKNKTTHCRVYTKDGIMYCDNPGNPFFTQEGLLSMQLAADRAGSRRQVLLVVTSSAELSASNGTVFKETLCQLTRVLHQSAVKSLAQNLILVLNSLGLRHEGASVEESLKHDLSRIRESLEHQKAEIRQREEDRQNQKKDRLDSVTEDRYAQMTPMTIADQVRLDYSDSRSKVSFHARREPTFDTLDEIERMQELLLALEQRLIIMSDPNDPALSRGIRELIGRSVDVPSGTFDFRALYNAPFRLEQCKEIHQLNQNWRHQISKAKIHLSGFEVQEKELQMLRPLERMYVDQLAALDRLEEECSVYEETYECPPKTRVITSTHEIWGGLRKESVSVEHPDNSEMTYKYGRIFSNPVVGFQVNGRDVPIPSGRYEEKYQVSYQHKYLASQGTKVTFKVLEKHPVSPETREKVTSKLSDIRGKISSLEKLLDLTPGTTIASLMGIIEDCGKMDLMKSQRSLMEARERCLEEILFEQWVISDLPPLSSSGDACRSRTSPKVNE